MSCGFTGESSTNSSADDFYDLTQSTHSDKGSSACGSGMEW